MSQGLKDAVQARDTIIDAGRQIEELIPRVTELWQTIGSGLETMYDGHNKAQQSIRSVMEAMRKKEEDDRREKERLRRELNEARKAGEENERLRKELEEARKAGEEASRKLRSTRGDLVDAQKRLRDRNEELRRKALSSRIPLFLLLVWGL